MAKIVSGEIRVVTRSTILLATSYGVPVQRQSHVILKLTDEDGVTGWGESTPLTDFSGETVSVVEMLVRDVYLPEIIGLDSSQIAEAHRRMVKRLPANPASRMVIDLAMHDLLAKEFGVPMYQLLGGKVRDASRINRHLGIMSIEDAVNKTTEYREHGFTSIKMKIGGDVEADIRRAKAVRKTLGDAGQLRVDANGGYSYSDAMKFIKGTDDLNIEMYEQLLHKRDFEGSVKLQRLTGVPIGIDEGLCSVEDAIRYAGCHGASIFILKLVKTAGLYHARAIAQIAQEAGITCVCSSTYDTQINAGACLQLAVSLPNSTIGNDLTCYATQPTQADTCHILRGNMLYVGDEPGVGVRSLEEFAL